MSTNYTIHLSDDHSVEVTITDDGGFELDGKPFDIDAAKTGKRSWNVLHDRKSYNVRLMDFDKSRRSLTLSVDEETFDLRVGTELDVLLKKMGMQSGGENKMGDVKAPMPGLVLKVLVEAGKAVKAGDPLIILEAMKMENVIKATGDGTVRDVLVGNQDAVEKNQLLIEME